MTSEIPLIQIGDQKTDAKQSTNTRGSENDFDIENTVTDGLTRSASGQLSVATPDGFDAYRYMKTLSQGLMDISLFSANANQLRYILEYGSGSSAFSYITSFLIVLSLLLQIGVGVMLLLSIRFSVLDKEQRRRVYEDGNNITIAIFLITAINVFIAAFGGTIEFSIPAGSSILNDNNRLVNATFNATN